MGINGINFVRKCEKKLNLGKLAVNLNSRKVRFLYMLCRHIADT